MGSRGDQLMGAGDVDQQSHRALGEGGWREGDSDGDKRRFM